MQTFLPLPCFRQSAEVLDRARLGKQRVEVLQILRALRGETRGWRNHPAVLMWAGHERALAAYGLAICDEWVGRGYRDACAVQIGDLYWRADEATEALPVWYGSPRFHSSHRAALLAKAPEHYGRFGWVEQPAIDYWWPTKDQS